MAKRLVFLPKVYKGKRKKQITQKNTVNEEKLKYNKIRARNAIQEYGLCNDWNYFFTATIDGKIGRDHNLTIKYLIVPELHKDRVNWHAHGLISGLPKEYLTEFDLNDKLPIYIIKKIQNNQKVYEFKEYTEKFGYNDFEEIRDQKRTVNYLIKYISKDIGRSITEMGKHMYFASKGLNKAKEIARGTLPANSHVKFDYECARFGVKWYGSDENPEKVLEKYPSVWQIYYVDGIEDIIAQQERLLREEKVEGK